MVGRGRGYNLHNFFLEEHISVCVDLLPSLFIFTVIISSLNILNGYFIYHPTQAPTPAPPPCEAKSLTAHIRLGLFGLSVSSWYIKITFFLNN